MDHPRRRRRRRRRRRWWIDVKTISCRGVKSFIPFQKPSLYAILSLVKNHRRHHEHDDDDDDDDDEQRQRQRQQRTPVDLDGGENPEWDHPMRLSFSSPRVGPLLLRFDVAAHGIPLLGDKVLAAAQVPVAHLLNAAAEESLRRLSYELRAPDGKPNGVLAFSFRITTLGAGGITGHDVDPSFNVSACAPQYSPPTTTTNVVLYPPLDYPPPPPPPEIYPPPPPPRPRPRPPLEPFYPPPGTRFPWSQAHDLELYPPPSAPPPVACYPPQDPGCSYPTPRGTDNGWDRRRLFGGSN